MILDDQLKSYGLVDLHILTIEYEEGALGYQLLLQEAVSDALLFLPEEHQLIRNSDGKLYFLVVELRNFFPERLNLLVDEDHVLNLNGKAAIL